MEAYYWFFVQGLLSIALMCAIGALVCSVRIDAALENLQNKLDKLPERLSDKIMLALYKGGYFQKQEERDG